jgi:dTMP kinase
MQKFIVMEGLDGAGKSTQIERLTTYLSQRNIQFHFFHFPQTESFSESPIYGEMVAKFLKGDYGDIDSVNPYLVALLYAGDRNNAKNKIYEWLEKDHIVVLDRYVYSNMAFQGAKISSHREKVKLRQWIHHLEYDYNRIPKPPLSVFLHMPFGFISRNLKDSREGDDRKYLEGKDDIHEKCLDFQKNVENEYLELVNTNDDFKLIECFDRNGTALPPEDIHCRLVELLIDNKMLPQE